MTNLSIDFEWRRARSYEVDETIDGQAIRQTSSTVQRYSPLIEHANLYLDFARLDGTPEQLLEFVHKVGFLEASPEKGKCESVQVWRSAIKDLNNKIKSTAAGNAIGQKFAAEGFRTRRPVTSVEVVLATALGGRHSLVFAPRTLMQAMLLQFAQSVTSGASIAACQQCGTWFEVGGEGKRTVARFCSDRCRNRFNYERRAKQ
jgi:hypothetical protein